MLEDEYDLDDREPDETHTISIELEVEQYDIKGDYDEDERFLEARRYVSEINGYTSTGIDPQEFAKSAGLELKLKIERELKDKVKDAKR